MMKKIIFAILFWVFLAVIVKSEVNAATVDFKVNLQGDYSSSGKSSKVSIEGVDIGDATGATCAPGGYMPGLSATINTSNVCSDGFMDVAFSDSNNVTSCGATPVSHQACVSSYRKIDIRLPNIVDSNRSLVDSRWAADPATGRIYYIAYYRRFGKFEDEFYTYYGSTDRPLSEIDNTSPYYVSMNYLGIGGIQGNPDNGRSIGIQVDAESVYYVWVIYSWHNGNTVVETAINKTTNEQQGRVLLQADFFNPGFFGLDQAYVNGEITPVYGYYPRGLSCSINGRMSFWYPIYVPPSSCYLQQNTFKSRPNGFTGRGYYAYIEWKRAFTNQEGEPIVNRLVIKGAKDRFSGEWFSYPFTSVAPSFDGTYYYNPTNGSLTNYYVRTDEDGNLIIKVYGEKNFEINKGKLGTVSGIEVFDNKVHIALDGKFWYAEMDLDGGNFKINTSYRQANSYQIVGNKIYYDGNAVEDLTSRQCCEASCENNGRGCTNTVRFNCSDWTCETPPETNSLDFGINSFVRWFQSVGSDMRWDKGSGFTGNLTLPANQFASVEGTGGMPGVLFSGSTSFFPESQASRNPFNWQVGSPLYPDFFTDTHDLIPTSYDKLLKAGAEIPSTDITSLSPGLAPGLYKVNGDLTVNSSPTFGAGNYVFLISGNLNINAKIKVPVGSTAIFSAKGNITVNQNVGESNPASLTPDIEGLYSADANFIADQTDLCPGGVHNRLNVAGSAIANAGRGTGTFVNNRSLCADNPTYPSVSFIERPDFMLNYPSWVKQTTRAWQELAP